MFQMNCSSFEVRHWSFDTHYSSLWLCTIFRKIYLYDTRRA